MTPDRESQMETQAPDTARAVETAEYLGFMYEDIGNEMIALARERDAQAAQIATLTAEVERLHDSRRKMHRRAQAAEGKLLRLQWWFEDIVLCHPRDEFPALHEKLNAALRGDGNKSSPAFRMMFRYFIDKYYALADRAEAAEGRKGEAT